jgi:hypothetical protein
MSFLSNSIYFYVISHPLLPLHLQKDDYNLTSTVIVVWFSTGKKEKEILGRSIATNF